MTKVGDSKVDPYQASNALLSDVIINYRTVIGFGQRNVDQINSNFNQLIEEPLNEHAKAHNKTGMYYGFGACGRSLYIGILFTVALEVLITKWGYNREQVFFATLLCFFGIMGVGF